MSELRLTKYGQDVMTHIEVDYLSLSVGLKPAWCPRFAEMGHFGGVNGFGVLIALGLGRLTKDIVKQRRQLHNSNRYMQS